MPKTSEKGKNTWEDWAKRVISPGDVIDRSWFNVLPKIYFLYAWVIKPTKNLSESILRYIETDDPETKDEQIAFDQLETELRSASLALRMAKQQHINRRSLAVSFWSWDRVKLSSRARDILLEAVQRTSRVGDVPSNSRLEYEELKNSFI